MVWRHRCGTTKRAQSLREQARCRVLADENRFSSTHRHHGEHQPGLISQWISRGGNRSSLKLHAQYAASKGYHQCHPTPCQIRCKQAATQDHRHQPSAIAHHTLKACYSTLSDQYRCSIGFSRTDSTPVAVAPLFACCASRCAAIARILSTSLPTGRYGRSSAYTKSICACAS